MNKAAYIGLISMVMVFLFLHINRRPTPKYGEILPASEMKAKYHITSDDYKPPKLDPAKVPESLRDLLPLAAKWGIGDDIIREDFEQKASESEKQELKNALSRSRLEQIDIWLNSYPSGKLMSEESACFMYMQEALDEMGLYPKN